MGSYPDSDTAETEAACKMRAVEQFVKVREELWAQRENYALTLGLRRNESVSGAKVDKHTTVNLSFRYMQRLTAEVTGQPLHLKMSRDAGEGQSPQGAPEAGAVGDEAVAEWVEKGVGRVLYEAGFQRETDAVVVDLCAYGVAGAWVGYHADIVGLEEAREASREISGDPEEADPNDPTVVAETMTGDLEAKRGQPHDAISSTLRDAAATLPIGADLDVMVALHTRAQSHDAQAAKEEKEKYGDPRIRAQEIWLRRGIVGFDTYWHPGVYEFRDSPWLCRRALVRLEVFKTWPEVKAKYRREAKGVADRYRPTVATPGRTSTATPEAEKTNDPAEKYVEVYEFWLKEPWRTDGGRRKMACPEFRGEWIEENEGNPLIDGDGKPLIPGFYPFFYCAPILPPLEDPKRTFAVPLIEPGAQTEQRIIEFLSTILAHYKRHGFRVYAMHPLIKAKKRLKEALRRGEDGFAFDAPDGVKDAKDMQGLVVPIQFSGQAEQMERMLAKLIEFWRIEQGFPAAALLGAAQSETATQETIGVEAGQNELGVIAGRIEEWAGEVARGVLGLMRGLYRTEKMRELLGAEGAKAWDLYRKTSTAGDRLTVTLGARAARSEAVNVKQIMDAIEVARTTFDPAMPAIRLLDDMQLVEELYRALKVGKPRRLPAETLAQQILAQLTAAMAGPEGAPPSQEGSAPQNGKAPGGAVPDEANMNSGVRRNTYRYSGNQ